MYLNIDITYWVCVHKTLIYVLSVKTCTICVLPYVWTVCVLYITRNDCKIYESGKFVLRDHFRMQIMCLNEKGKK